MTKLASGVSPSLTVAVELVPGRLEAADKHKPRIEDNYAFLGYLYALQVLYAALTEDAGTAQLAYSQLAEMGMLDWKGDHVSWADWGCVWSLQAQRIGRWPVTTWGE